MYENTTYQNVWEAATTMVRGKFITRNALLKGKILFVAHGDAKRYRHAGRQFGGFLQN